MNVKIVIYASMSIIPILLTIYSKRKHKKFLKSLSSPDKFFYKFIFITFKNRTCTTHLNKRSECSTSCSYRFLKSIITAIKSAKKSISLCMYHFTIDDIHLAIVEAKKRGVNVKCVTDNVMIECSGTKVILLKDAGIPVKVQPSKRCLMHHKYMLIDENDEDPQLLFGSMNYTMHALLYNWDHIICTNNTNMIQRFSDEFKDLWLELEEI